MQAILQKHRGNSSITSFPHALFRCHPQPTPNQAHKENFHSPALRDTPRTRAPTTTIFPQAPNVNLSSKVPLGDFLFPNSLQTPPVPKPFTETTVSSPHIKCSVGQTPKRLCCSCSLDPIDCLDMLW